jgi:hypothetical protein
VAGSPNKKREIGGHNSIAPMGPSRIGRHGAFAGGSDVGTGGTGSTAVIKMLLSRCAALVYQ